ncbi:unnamed protein product [Miscanthus lutarioriparius]|uniref:ENTH/VHS family protein n=1 Tax=Miscanthus lutarioriparius TaxID=422564 RepID=A0A811RFF8_9POAL|nr:unnamed protein product [Miscanthus lutarioriparius]
MSFEAMIMVMSMVHSILIGIWDERKVFGTRIESLKDSIFGDNPPIFDNNGNKNNSNPSSKPLNSKVARKDSSTVLKKLTVGGMPEKIVTAYQAVLDQHFDEDTALNKCKSTVSVLEKIKKNIDDASTKEQTAAMIQSSGVRQMSPQLQSLNPATSLAPTVSAVGDEPKRTAAAMADKLASLSAPVQVLSSILSSFVAEHGASLSSMNSGSPSGELSGGLPGFQIEKRPRLEKTAQGSDMGAPPFSVQVPQMQQQIGAVPTQLPAQINQVPGPFAPPPPPFLPPLLQQFGQSTGGMMEMGPFGMTAGSMPPPPPMSNIMPAGFPGPSGPPPPPRLPPAQNQPQQQQESPQAPQQSPTSAGFFQSSAGMGFFPPVKVQQSPSAQRQ